MRRRNSPQSGRIREVLEARRVGGEDSAIASPPGRPPAAAPPRPGTRTRPRRGGRRWGLYGTVAALVACLGGLSLWELETSRLQSWLFARFAKDISHWVAAGPNPHLSFPAAGPYDERFGYTRLPEILPRLDRRGFEVVAQARVSPRFQEVLEHGLHPIYQEKAQAGLTILDRSGRPVFARAYPEQVLAQLEDAPSLVVQSLLFVENRRLLDEGVPYQNPVMDWRRLGTAVTLFGLRTLGKETAVPGASTLATQLEKFRHSPGGLTDTPNEKLRQMLSASLRTYYGGRETLAARRRIALDYLNGVPLSAIANRGEVHGLLDGLWYWYGIEPEELAMLHAPTEAESRERAATVYRAALNLIVASRGPSFYLATADGRRALDALTDVYLNLLEEEGVVPSAFAADARQARAELRFRAPAARTTSDFDRKAANAFRSELLALVGAASLYDLDRYDLLVATSLDEPTQRRISEELARLGQPQHQISAGLTGYRLLPASGTGSATYSFLLYESTPDGNRLRVQTDSFHGPLDVNRQTQLELGSTAKLRTLITYLETVEALYNRLYPVTAGQRAAYLQAYGDPLTQWFGQLLASRPTLTLEEALAFAMSREYSANPGQRFFTAGGVHRFSNFDRTFDHRMLSVEEAFNHSVNLVFVRMMRDIVDYHVQRLPDAVSALRDSRHPTRRMYLERFADHEGRIFLTRFHNDHAGKTLDESIERMLAGREPTQARYARLFRAVLPDAGEEELAAFLAARAAGARLSREELERVYRSAAPEGHGLADLAYLAGVHPLELWVVRHLARNPGAALGDTLAAGRAARQEAYDWLFRTSRSGAQDERIRIVLEAEAFFRIHRDWQRLGYPFSGLVPSYATALGSSGDNPQALAELVGILVNDGLRFRPVTIEAIQFAAGTPFETRLRVRPEEARRVLSTEVARTARAAMRGVVEEGTGRRLINVFTADDGMPFVVGGKTGTGDNRLRVTGARGQVLAERPRSRTAALVFFIGNYYGVVSAYVEGEQSGEYAFTSALPAQLLRHLAPLLEPLLKDGGEPRVLTTAVVPAAAAAGATAVPLQGTTAVAVSGNLAPASQP